MAEYLTSAVELLTMPACPTESVECRTAVASIAEHLTAVKCRMVLAECHSTTYLRAIAAEQVVTHLHILLTDLHTVRLTTTAADVQSRIRQRLLCGPDTARNHVQLHERSAICLAVIEADSVADSVATSSAIHAVDVAAEVAAADALATQQVVADAAMVLDSMEDLGFLPN